MRATRRSHGLCGAVLLFISACRSEAAGGLTAPVRRVVSLHDVTTEMVVTLAATEQLVGIPRLVDPTPSVQAAVATLPEASSLESILALGPSLVLGLELTEQEQPGLVAHLEAEGIAVYLGRPGNLGALYTMTSDVGGLLGVAPRAEHLNRELQSRIDRSRSTEAPSRRVFVYDCCNPPFSAGGRGVLNELITLAGGQNIFADVDDDWTTVSWEEVLARRPELIVIHVYGQADVAGKRAQLAKLPGLGGIPTTTLPLGCSLGGLRSAEGLERLRQALEGSS
jgi:iron complex transport system substrate-binding protein